MNSTPEKELFTYWITHPQELEASDRPMLEKMVSSHPYCQIGHLLLAKHFSRHEPGKLSYYLPKAAIYSPDRKVLKNLIENDTEWSELLNARLAETAPVQPVPVLVAPTEKVAEPQPDTFENQLVPPEQVNLKNDGDNERLVQQALGVLPEPELPAEPVTEADVSNQKDIIEKFIGIANGSGVNRIVINESDEFEDLSTRNLPDSANTFATEALAQIMIRQGKNERAIQIYEQLMLKKPEKLDYFAQKIKELK